MFEDINIFHEQYLDSPNYQIMGISAALIGKGKSEILVITMYT